MPPELLVLADDLTGALEVGAKLRCAVRFEADTADVSGCVVIDTETRHLPAQAAYSRILDLLRAYGCPRVYKKTDSTLRGNIAAELAAMSAAYPGVPIAYVGAYPQMGRTVKAGQLYVDGKPLHETSFSRDPLHPARSSSISDLIGNVVSVTIYDGETDENVAEAVRGAGMLVCGPACVADHLAVRLGLEHQKDIKTPSVRNCLVVNGSLHELSVRQIDHAARHGWCIADPADIPGWLRERNWIILCLDDARRNARMVRDILKQVDVDALAVFGGDTAYEIVRALGERVIHPIAELLPGVPISRITDMYLITKAGGFGHEDVLSEIRGRLTP